MPGRDRVGAQPRAAPDRDIIGTSANPRRGGHAHRLLRRLRDGVFTLLGLWIIVVQTRHAEWRQSPVHSKGPDPAVVTSTPADLATTSRRGFYLPVSWPAAPPASIGVLYIQWSTPR
jgi:hypothetical protein